MEVTNLYRFGSVGRQRLPILGLIGEVSATKLSAWIEAGLDGCIGKPIEPTELIEAVNAYLGREAVAAAARQAVCAASGPQPGAGDRHARAPRP